MADVRGGGRDGPPSDGVRRERPVLFGPGCGMMTEGATTAGESGKFNWIAGAIMWEVAGVAEFTPGPGYGGVQGWCNHGRP